MGYDWPGNVRELINTVERAVILSPGPLIETTDLPSALQDSAPSQGMILNAGLTIREMERMLIERTLESTDQNRTRAAQLLGITRKTLQNKIKDFGLPPVNGNAK